LDHAREREGGSGGLPVADSEVHRPDAVFVFLPKTGGRPSMAPSTMSPAASWTRGEDVSFDSILKNMAFKMRH
jgi:hypothetical protein